jgi:hypothetical protein
MSSRIEIAPEILQPLVGAEVLKLLGEEQRNQLLVHAVHEAFATWDVRGSVRTVVAAAVKERVAEMLQEPEWKTRLHSAIDETLAEVVSQLPTRIAAAMAR